MPTPYLIRRPSGFYVRFGVPRDLRATLRTRFIVRSLHTADPVLARLIAATLGAGLSSVFTQMRRGRRMEFDAFKKGLKHLQDGTAKTWTASKVRLPSGLEMEGVQVANEDDARLFNAFVASHTAPGAIPVTPPPSLAPTPPTIPAEPAAPTGAMLFDRAEAYALGFRQSGVSHGNCNDTEHSLDMFMALMGDMPLAAITSDDMRRFFGYMERWPLNATKAVGLNRKKDKTPEERDAERAEKRATIPGILKKAPAKPKPGVTLGKRAVDKHKDALRKFFTWAIKEDLIAKHPMKGIKGLSKQDSDARTKLPFTPEDLAVAFKPDRFANHNARDPARFWGMALCLYTGARVGEIAQLHLEDVEQVEGTWGLHFRPWGTDQSQKNTHGLRFLPLHSALVEAGFVDYVNDIRAVNAEHAGQEANIERRRLKQPSVTAISRLFPNLPFATRGGYSDGLGDRINSYLRKQCNITDKQKSCHSFRHTFSTRLDRAGVDPARIAALTGHKREGVLEC